MATATVLAASMLGEPTVSRLADRLAWLPDSARGKIGRSYQSRDMVCSTALSIASEAHRLPSSLGAARRTLVRDEFLDTHPILSRWLDLSYAPGSLPMTDVGNLGSTRLNAIRCAAIAVEVVLGGYNDESFEHACQCLGLAHVAPALRQTWDEIGESADGCEVFAEALALRVALMGRAKRIHYTRRRHTFSAPALLSKRSASEAAKELGISNTAHLRTYISYFVWELLSGSSVELHPQHQGQFAHVLRSYRRIRKEWVKEPPTSILRIAERQLVRHKIDEPIAYKANRLSDGSWELNPLDQRTLDGWQTRDLRRSARFETPGQLRLATPDQLADYLASVESPMRTRLRRAVDQVSGMSENGLDEDMWREGHRDLEAHREAVETFVHVTGRHPLDLISWPIGTAPRPLWKVLSDSGAARSRLVTAEQALASRQYVATSAAG